MPETTSLLNRQFLPLLGAQFFSALSDNAMLIALIAQLTRGGAPESQNALLQELFVIPFILLAPFAGPLADFLPKNKVLLYSNLIKMFGALLAVAQINPFVSYGIIGIGACLYSPAKYGILPQLCDELKIISANSALEGSTIAAILLGVLAGGALAQMNPNFCLIFCLVCYGIAFSLNLFIPYCTPHQSVFPKVKLLFSDFYQALKVFMADPDCRASLAGSASFWGSGSALRLALFAWAPSALLAPIETAPSLAAHLMGVMALGTVFGAIFASYFGHPTKLARSFISGLLIGPLVIVLSFSAHTFLVAACFLFAVGGLGGFFVIPLNAVIQEKGFHTVGSGRALAVQNLFENTTILFCSAFYGFISTRRPPIESSASLGALLFLLTLFAFILWRVGKRSSEGSP